MIYPKGHEFEYKVLKPSQMKTDPLYQRPLDIKRVEKIAKEFNGDIFNNPTSPAIFPLPRAHDSMSSVWQSRP